MEKWVKLSTSWKKISFGTKPLLQHSRARNPQRRLQLSEGLDLALCKERRVYRTVGSMKYKHRAKRFGADWYKICTKGYLVLHNCVSVSHKGEQFNGKAFRKKKVGGRH
jgi:hypothetical protein